MMRCGLVLVLLGWGTVQAVAAENWREPVTGMEFVPIPAACFQMGNPDVPEGLYGAWWVSDERKREGPQHSVCFKEPFHMSKTEVTKGQFAAFVAATGYKTEAERGEKPKKFNWRNAGDVGVDFEVGFEQGDQHPVVHVSWNDAQAYIQWLSEKTGKQYRLPSESEWEYAARAGTTTPYSFGDDADKLCQHGNGADLTLKSKRSKVSAVSNCQDGYSETAPVGSFTANAWGLHDMHGNVDEWAQDCWHSNYISAPGDGSAWVTDGFLAWTSNGGDCRARMLRGGGWRDEPRDLRVISRYPGKPDIGVSFIGFRLVVRP